MGGLSFKDGIVHYYLFQKIISNYFNKQKYEKDERKINEGYIVDPEWIKFWIKKIKYDKIKNYLDKLNITENNYDQNKEKIQKYFGNYINELKIKEISEIIINNDNNNFDLSNKKIIDQKILVNFMVDRVFKSQKINEKINKIKVKYILKKQMLILGLEDYHIIKIIIPDISYFSENKNIVNLSWKFNYSEEYYSKLDFLKINNSEGIINYFIDKEIFANYSITTQGPIHFLINENIQNNENNNNQIDNNSNKVNDTKMIIKMPQDINFELSKKLNFLGLDNTLSSGMNSVLQCFVNIKPITNYLLNVNKYCEIYDNINLCPLTLQYYQILFGLFCNNSNTGSYSPKLFKAALEEMNPSLQIDQVTKPKDFILFLLKVLNKELTGLYNKTYNANANQNKSIIISYKSNQTEALKECLNDFKITHSSVIADNLCGFQKSIFTCENCKNVSYYFNSFEYLIFDLEIISKHLNLNDNNNIIITFSFDECFQYLFKEELFENNYCQYCKIKTKSRYKEKIYLILII